MKVVKVLVPVNVFFRAVKQPVVADRAGLVIAVVNHDGDAGGLVVVNPLGEVFRNPDGAVGLVSAEFLMVAVGFVVVQERVDINTLVEVG